MSFSIFFSSQALICREKAIICTKLHLCNFENEFSTLPVVFQLLFSFCLDFMVTSRSHACLFSPSPGHPFSCLSRKQSYMQACEAVCTVFASAPLRKCLFMPAFVGQTCGLLSNHDLCQTQNKSLNVG